MWHCGLRIEKEKKDIVYVFKLLEGGGGCVNEISLLGLMGGGGCVNKISLLCERKAFFLFLNQTGSVPVVRFITKPETEPNRTFF